MTARRILFCSPTPLNPKLGAAKVYIEVAAAFRRLGWDATALGPKEPAVLRDHLRSHAAAFDVVEYEHDRLPFPRSDFPPPPLFVARSVLLVHHLLSIPIPARPRLRAAIGQWLLGRVRRRRLAAIVADATRTCREADVVNVSNADDAAALIEAGIDPAKVAVFPFGLTAKRRAELAVAGRVPPSPTLAFVGTFDPRKGMRDFPDIVGRVCEAMPAARFKLIGTRGMVPGAAGVLAHFPRRLRARVEVIPEFEPSELPGLLAVCAVGIFPSAVEGFGFGVLEMLAAGLPVVAYRAPGPPEMLPDEYLVPRGDAAAMAAKVVHFLGDVSRLAAARTWAITRAADFDWDDIARRTAERYEQLLAFRAPRTPG